MTNTKIPNTPALTSAKTCPAPPSAFLLRFALSAFILLVALASATTPAHASTNFGSINVCPAGATTPAPCAANQTVTFTIPAGTTISKIDIVTTGIPDLDFKAKADDANNTLCKAQHYSSATTCTVDVTFAPLAAGGRQGAVELLDGTTVVALTYVYGIGVGPVVAFAPPTLHALPPRPAGVIDSVAVDAIGNLFVAIPFAPDGSFTGVMEYSAADGYTTSKALFTGSIFSLALDGAGNIFIGKEGSNDVLELVAAQSYAPKTISEEYNGLLALDASGNLFVAVGGEVGVKELLASTDYTTVKTVGSYLKDLFSIVVDPAGNVFVSDLNPDGVQIIKEITVASGYTTVKDLNSSTSNGYVVGVDAADNLYFDRTTSPGVIGLYQAVSTGGYTEIRTVYPGSSSLVLVYGAVDGSGNFYLADADGGTAVYKLTRSQAPDFAFAATSVGSTSTPQSTTLQNIGNATLAGSLSLTDDTDFSLVAGSGNPPDCPDSLSLASSAECNLSIAFTPQSTGPLTASTVIAGNIVTGTESIALSGTGVAAEAEVSPTILQFGSIPLGGSESQTLTISNVGSGTLTVDPSSNGRGAIITGSNCGAGIAAGKSCNVQVEFKPVQLGPNHNTVTIGTNIGLSPQVPVHGTATGVGSVSTSLDFGTIYQNDSQTEVLTVTNYGVPGNVTVSTQTGATTFKVTSNSCTSGVTSGNSCAIQVAYSPVEQGTQTAYLKLTPSTGPSQSIKMTGTMVRVP